MFILKKNLVLRVMSLKWRFSKIQNKQYRLKVGWFEMSQV